jgi:L-ascorbate metabolism protein UlaG (beta-lactamase superfamily)
MDIAARLGAPDVALLPIGAYEPRWFMAPVHMNPGEAVEAHRMLGPVSP